MGRSIRRFRVVAAVAALAGSLVVPAAAEPLPVRCDRQQGWPGLGGIEYDTTRMRTVRIAGQFGDENANVLLPPGYDTPGNTRRYPVVYVLHGGSWGPDEGPNVWPNYTPIISLTENEPHVIAVFPYGGANGIYTDWRDGSQQWESYHLKDVIPFIDAHYRTIPDRAYRAVTGESMGGVGSLLYAGRHPDMFVAAAPFSGGVELSSGLGVIVGASYEPAGLCAGATSLDGVWGNPATDEVWLHAHNPGDLAVNYGGVTLNTYMGNGVPCDLDDETIAESSRGYTGFEAAFRPFAEQLAQRWRQAGIPFNADFPSCGMHSFHDIGPALVRAWPRIVGAFGSPPPAAFDYRAVESSFSVWDWTFAADAARATEFLDIADASCRGLGLTGSGLTKVTTARCFRPRSRVLVNGSPVRADASGRITFTVDLGPAHQFQQFTPAARTLEAAGGYWTSTTVTFTRGASS